LPKIHHLLYIAELSGYIFATEACKLSTITKKRVKQQFISSTCPHNMVNFGPLTAEIGWWVLGTPANFNGFRILAGFFTAPMSLNRGQPNFARCLAVCSASTLCVHFGGLLPPNVVLPGAKFTLYPTCVLLYWQRYCTAPEQQVSVKLRRLAEGATYIRQRGHYVEDWPTF